jgi:hypothetical protein
VAALHDALPQELMPTLPPLPPNADDLDSAQDPHGNAPSPHAPLRFVSDAEDDSDSDHSARGAATVGAPLSPRSANAKFAGCEGTWLAMVDLPDDLHHVDAPRLPQVSAPPGKRPSGGGDGSGAGAGSRADGGGAGAGGGGDGTPAAEHPELLAAMEFWGHDSEFDILMLGLNGRVTANVAAAMAALAEAHDADHKMHEELLMPVGPLDEVRTRMARMHIAGLASDATLHTYMQVQHARMIASPIEFCLPAVDVMEVLQTAAQDRRRKQLQQAMAFQAL